MDPEDTNLRRACLQYKQDSKLSQRLVLDAIARALGPWGLMRSIDEAYYFRARGLEHDAPLTPRPAVSPMKKRHVRRMIP